MIILKILFWLIIVLLFYRIILGVVRKFVHFPAPAFISVVLDSRIRKKIQPPDVINRFSGITAGKNVLEIGSGSGFFTIPAARAVGKDGKVSALDIQQEMLDKIIKKLSKDENKDISNIHLVKASAYEIPFPAESFDVVFTVSVLQEIPEPHSALLEAHRVLKAGGTVSVSEFIPDPDWPLPGKVEKQLRTAGFRNIKRNGNLFRYTVTGVKYGSSNKN